MTVRASSEPSCPPLHGEQGPSGRGGALAAAWEALDHHGELARRMDPMEAQGGLWESAHGRKPKHSWQLSLPSAAYAPLLSQQEPKGQQQACPRSQFPNSGSMRESRRKAEWE